MKYIIGIDIGTTSTKACIFDEQGKLIKTSNVEYPLYHDEVDMAEQNPDEIFQAVVRTLKEVSLNQENIQGVSFSAAMHSVILMDEKMNPLSRSITWADNRAKHVAQRLKENGIGQKIYEKTGTPIHPMAPLSKLIWLKEEHAELFKQTAYFIGIKEYVFYRLFGELKMDSSVASATGMFNIHEQKWSKEALDLIGITSKQLPEVVPTSYQFKSKDFDFPFIIGSTDGPLANLGVNAVGEGKLALTIGTSGALRTVGKKPIIHPEGKSFSYLLDEELYVSGGAVNNGGIIFRWLRDELFPDFNYSQLTQIAEKISVGANGLLFLPYLNGERAPIWNANARGSYFGLNTTHTKEHLLRAGLEGIIFNLYHVFNLLEVNQVQAIQATGGFMRSPFLCQMIADIFEKQVNIAQSVESACLGAVVLGMKSLGMVDELSEVEKMVEISTTYYPNEENFERYREMYEIYIGVSKQLQDVFVKIARVQAKYQ